MSHLSLPVRIISNTIERLAEAVTETRTSLSAYLNEHPEFLEIGGRMLAEWNGGVKEMFER